MANQESALWITPDNKVIPVTDKHITLIIGNPEKFGLDRKYIDSVYKKHKEPMGSEGNAREEIMTKLIEKNWIRIRALPRYYLVKFQVANFKPETINRIEKAIKQIVKKNIMDENYSVSIINLKAEDFLDKEDELTLAEIASGAMRDKKYVSKSDAEEKTGGNRYTSLATMYHENIKFTFLKSIDEYKTYINYLDEILNERKGE